MDLFKLFSASLAARKEYVQKNNIEAYRLYNLENTALPLAVDIYGKYAVIHIFEKIEPVVLTEAGKALKEILGIKGVFVKRREKGAEKKEQEVERKGEKTVVCEYGHKFEVNLSDRPSHSPATAGSRRGGDEANTLLRPKGASSYLDVGLFLDHRETRRWIAAQCAGKVVLNTFAYTGSFSVYAAAAGASKTYSVDLSKTYCDWIKRNFELNKLPPEKNWIYKMDTFEFFKYARRKGLKFDIIIIDPPTFSRSKKGSFSVQKNHPRLINEALAILKPSGFILFSTNFKEFRLNKNKLNSCRIRETKDKIPPDFCGAVPHKCFVIQSIAIYG